MEKVLVVSYRFPPADETGTQRTWALAKYLKDLGFYPVFITRNWERPLKTQKDTYIPVGDRILHEIHSNYEVYTLPYKNILRLRINKRFKGKWVFIRHIFNFIDQLLISQNCFLLSEYRPFIRQAQVIAKTNVNIKKALITADPFPLFYIGYLLKRKFNIRWIADYRDDWNTRTINDSYGFSPSFLHKLLYKVESRVERRWVSTASCITSVSDEYTQRIARFVKTKGVTIYNGFFEEEVEDFFKNKNESPCNVQKNIFTIIHNGTLYPTQQIEIFIEGLKRVVEEMGDFVTVRVKFIGVRYKEGAEERIDQLMKGFEHNYVCTGRINKEALYREINSAELALMISHGPAFKGVTSSKIFDYIALRKNILCCPSDGDVVEQILTETRLGHFCNTADEVYGFLKEAIDRFLNRYAEERQIDYGKCLIYSRKNQTKKVAELLRGL